MIVVLGSMHSFPVNFSVASVVPVSGANTAKIGPLLDELAYPSVAIVGTVVTLPRSGSQPLRDSPLEPPSHWENSIVCSMILSKESRRTMAIFSCRKVQAQACNGSRAINNPTFGRR